MIVIQTIRSEQDKFYRHFGLLTFSALDVLAYLCHNPHFTWGMNCFRLQSLPCEKKKKNCMDKIFQCDKATWVYLWMRFFLWRISILYDIVFKWHGFEENLWNGGKELGSTKSWHRLEIKEIYGTIPSNFLLAKTYMREWG